MLPLVVLIEVREMKWRGRIVLALAGISLVWCVAMIPAIASTGLWHQGAVQGAVLVPIVFAALATWAAWRRSRIGVLVCALVLLGFSFITGFSSGNAYLPAAGLLSLATALAAFPRFRTAR